MAESFEIIKNRSRNMIKRDKDNGNAAMFQAMWDMWNMNWEMDKKLSKHPYIRKMVSPDPHDAIRVGTQVLASVMPMPSINPLMPNIETRNKFDELERAVSWLFMQACQRKGNPLADIVRHALLFDRVAAQVVYLPNQEQITGAFKGESSRKSHALRYGPFAIVVRDPRLVHVEWSDYMPERVLYRSLMPAHEAAAFWGKSASKLVRKMRTKKYDTYDWVTVFDYHDLNTRKVWAVMQEQNQKMADPDDEDMIVIMDEDNKLDFLPWVVRDGAEQLDPILLPVWKTNLWNDMCLYETLMSSEIIAYSAAPRIKKESFNPDAIEVEYGTAGASVDHKPGESVEPFLPPQIDINLSALLDRLQGRMAKSTVPNVIQSVDFPSEWAFATLNLAVQSGVKVLTPAKELAQRALADVFRQMFYWIDYSGDKVMAYPTSQQIEDDLAGPLILPAQVEQIEISPDSFDVDHLYIDVSLEVDIPSDKVGRANTAVTLNERLQYTTRQSLEDVGVADPGAMMDEWEEEQRRRNELEIELEMAKEEAMTEVLLDREQQMMEIQVAAQQQAAQQQGVPPPPTGNEMVQDSIAGNPALGGTTAAPGNPAGGPLARANAQGTQIPNEGV
jgi:hypothetical protein